MGDAEIRSVPFCFCINLMMINACANPSNEQEEKIELVTSIEEIIMHIAPHVTGMKYVYF